MIIPINTSFDLDSMAGHNIWNMTRPTRRLATIIEAMPIFKEVAEGKKWDRALQKEFEDKLGESSVKTAGIVRDDSGGNRTWAVYPKIFGLWYEDEDDEKVKLTQAADNVIAGEKRAVEQMRHQILRFQWPNRTQEHKSQRMNEGFKIFPYRFIIKILLDPRIEYLLTSEIAFFILQVKTEKEFEEVIDEILKYRKERKSDGKSLSQRTDLISKHMKLRPGAYEEKTSEDEKNKAHLKYIGDLANTFMNHLEFFGEITHGKSEQTGNENQLTIKESKIKSLESVVHHYDKHFPFSPLYKKSNRRWFIENYGISYDKQKASRKTTKPLTKESKDLQLVKSNYMKLIGKKLGLSEKEIIVAISDNTGKSEQEIKRIISTNSEEFNFHGKKNDVFTKKFLEVGSDGDRHADFEAMTREIFQEFGLPTKKMKFKLETGNELEIDGFVKNESRCLSGIIDAKSGKKFSCNNKEVGIMKDYINRFKKYKDGKIVYKLDFFAYVYGKKFENIGNFKRIINETGIHGAVISANELLKIKEKFERKELSQNAIWALLKSDNEIIS